MLSIELNSFDYYAANHVSINLTQSKSLDILFVWILLFNGLNNFTI